MRCILDDVPVMLVRRPLGKFPPGVASHWEGGGGHAMVAACGYGHEQIPLG